MKKRMLAVTAILVMTLTLGACGAPEEIVEVEPEPTVTAHGIDAPGFERTMITADRINNGEVYVHGEDGYYLLAEHGADTKLKAQVGGTCWANAAASSMESNYLYTRGEEITVDPYEIVDIVYDENKKEGLMPDRFNKMEFGGLGWFIMEVLSNGFGDYVLTGGEIPAREHIVAYGYFLVNYLVDKALVHALVMAAEDNEVIVVFRKLHGFFLRKHLSLGRHIDNVPFFAGVYLGCSYRCIAIVYRYGAHKHTHTAAVGSIIHAAVLILGIIAYIVCVYFYCA